MQLNFYFGFKKLDPDIRYQIQSYLKRISHEIHIQLRFFKNDKELLKALEGVAYYCLDPKGTTFTSESFAAFLFERLEKATLSFVVGGAYGLPIECRQAPFISLSSLTLPHQLAILICIEQIYRAWTIHRNMPYHK